MLCFFRVAFVEFRSEALAEKYKKSLVGRDVNGCKIETVDYVGEKSENKLSQRTATSDNQKSKWCLLSWPPW